MTPHDEVLQAANSLPSWIINLSMVFLIFLQTLIFARISLRYRGQFNITGAEIKKAVRSGIITTIGPALSVFIVGLALITQIGAPLSLSRLSVVGNAVYETTAAEVAASTLGTSINSDTYSLSAFTCSVWVMNIGGALMILPHLLFLKPFSKVRQKVNQRGNLGKIIGICASLASFGYFALDYSIKDMQNFVAVGSAALFMWLLTYLGNRCKKSWLKEWAMALAILIAITAASII